MTTFYLINKKHNKQALQLRDNDAVVGQEFSDKATAQFGRDNLYLQSILMDVVFLSFMSLRVM